MQGTINLTATEVFVSYGGALYNTQGGDITLWATLHRFLFGPPVLSSLKDQPHFTAHTHTHIHTGCRCMVSVIECVLVANCCFSLYTLLLVFHQPLFSSQGLGGCSCTALLGSPDIASCLQKGHKWPHRITWTTVGKTGKRGSPLTNAVLATSVPKAYMPPTGTFNSHYQCECALHAMYGCFISVCVCSQTGHSVYKIQIIN